VKLEMMNKLRINCSYIIIYKVNRTEKLYNYILAIYFYFSNFNFCKKNYKF